MEHLVQSGKISEAELFDINELRHDLKQDAITVEPKQAEAAKILPMRKAK